MPSKTVFFIMWVFGFAFWLSLWKLYEVAGL